MAHRIVFSPEAYEDLEQLYQFVADQAGERVALSYIERIETYCRGFADFPERGLLRDDLFPGLRIVGFERRLSIAFRVEADTVYFDRILYGGRDIDTLLTED